MTLDYYESLCGKQRVSVRLAVLLHLKDLLENGSAEEALKIITTACAVDERKQLREVREEVWHRLTKARISGDIAEIKACHELLKQVDEAKKTLAV